MHKHNKSIVSIVMATYNRAGQLKSTVKNIFEQSYENIELVIINDGSSDNTIDILKDLQNSYDFNFINNAQNVGLQKSLNIGIKHANGKFIARIDDHDKWIDSDKIKKQVSYLEQNPSVGLVGTGYMIGTKQMRNPLTDSDIRKQILLRSPFCHVSVVMKKEIIDKVSGYNEDLPYSEDWDLWLKIGKETSMVNLPDITVAIQEDDISLSQDFYLKQIPINHQIVKQYYNDYPWKTKALLYHNFIRYFFAIFPVNGKVHKLMKRVFLNYFALTSIKNISNEQAI